MHYPCDMMDILFKRWHMTHVGNRSPSNLLFSYCFLYLLLQYALNRLVGGVFFRKSENFQRRH